MRFLKKVAGRGNVTLPSDIREAMGIEDGDIIEFQIVGVVRRKDEANRETTQPTGHITPS